MEAALTCFRHWRGHRGDGEPRQIKEAVANYLELYGDARFTNIMDDTRLHGERSGYWRDTHKGREWLLTKAGLMQATKGFDLKQVVSVLKACGWLQLDSEGKSATRVNIKNNDTGKNRFFCIVPIYDSCSYEKTGGIGGTGGTTSNGAAYSDTTENNKGGTGGTLFNQMPDESTTCTTREKHGGTATAPAVTSRTTCTTDTTEKTGNANKFEKSEDWGQI